MRELRQIKYELENNITVIEKNYEILTNELEGLRTSAERIALEARNIGYFRKNEGIIIAEGYNVKKQYFTLGKLVNVNYDKGPRKPLLRGISIGAILFSLILVFIIPKRNEDNQKR